MVKSGSEKRHNSTVILCESLTFGPLLYQSLPSFLEPRSFPSLSPTLLPGSLPNLHRIFAPPVFKSESCPAALLLVESHREFMGEITPHSTFYEKSKQVTDLLHKRSTRQWSMLREMTTLESLGFLFLSGTRKATHLRKRYQIWYQMFLKSWKNA